MRRAKLGLELVAHFGIGQQIITLAGQEPGYRNLIILIGFDSELATVVPVRDQSLIQLLHRERERQVLRMPVTDVAHQPVKNAI